MDPLITAPARLITRDATRFLRLRQVETLLASNVLVVDACRNAVQAGVTWVDGELWHGVWEEARAELRHLDPRSDAVLESLEMPEGTGVSGLESDGADRFFCGGGPSGRLRALRRPRAKRG